MSVVEYEVGCSVCERPVMLKGGIYMCALHGVVPENLLGQTGRKHRRQFVQFSKLEIYNPATKLYESLSLRG